MSKRRLFGRLSKPMTLLFLTLLTALFLRGPRGQHDVQAAVTLSASDLVVVGMNTRPSPSDEWALLALADIAGNSVIFI